VQRGVSVRAATVPARSRSELAAALEILAAALKSSAGTTRVA
jgi:hypothetical protein